jgi:hypothetical protein
MDSAVHHPSINVNKVMNQINVFPTLGSATETKIVKRVMMRTNVVVKGNVQM